ncbi:3-phosphoshikimate 1-carboxyvinyltransferase [Brooklawnia cerclae]
MAGAPSRLIGVLRARDSDLMIDALCALGAQISDEPSESDGSPILVVRPPDAFQAVPSGIDCGLAGTVMRFVPPIAALAPGTTRFFGDERAGERPMAPLLDGLRQLGAEADADSLPFTLTAPHRLRGPEVAIDSSASSQFVSALLLAAPRLPHGIVLHHTGSTVPSAPHIAMTVAMLRARGVEVDDSRPGVWRVSPGVIAARDQRIEPDLTNASVFLAAGVVSGGRVTVPGWPSLTTQPGDHIRHVLDALGARYELVGDLLTAHAAGPLHGADLDLHAASELTPVVAALAVFAEGTTVIRGVGHIRGHETDRIAAIARELASLGVHVDELDDGLRIEGAGFEGTGLRPTRPLRAYADHRLAHLAAIVGLKVPGVVLDDIAAVGKTMPDFTTRWDAMLAAGAGTRA